MLSALFKKDLKSAAVSVLFFCGGVVFDVFTLQKLDDTYVLINQVLTISAIWIIISSEIVGFKFRLPKKLSFAEKYKSKVLQVCFGAALSAHLIFFYRSFGDIYGLIFFSLIALVAALGEFYSLYQKKQSIRVGIAALCTCSTFTLLSPIFIKALNYVTGLVVVVGFIGFIVSLSLALLFFRVSRGDIRRKLWLPSGSVFIFFTIAYYFGLVPPVPFQIKHAGVYNSVEKAQNNRYRLVKNVIAEDTVLLGPERTLVFFSSIYSPVGFNQKLVAQWSFLDPKTDKWQVVDRISQSIVGGRERGFRTYTVKTIPQSGKWRVTIQTLDDKVLLVREFEVVDSANDNKVKTEDKLI